MEINYETMTDEELLAERELQKGIEYDAYQRFTRAAASKCASLVAAFSEAGAKQRKINEVLSRRRG